MSIQALLVYRLSDKDPIKLTSIFSLPTLWLFQKSRAEEIMIFVGRTVASRVNQQMHQIIEEQGYRCFVYRYNHLVFLAIASCEYPNRACFSFLHTSCDIFTQSYPLWDDIQHDVNLNCQELITLLDKYQQPEEADKLTKIRKDLDETKGVMIKNIDALLDRGEKLDDLFGKAENLTKGSKEFLIKTKKLNRCCIIV